MTTPRYNPAGWLRFLDRLEGVAEPHALIVRRGGVTVLEGYAAPWQQDDLQLLYSLSKTFTSAAAGLAVQDGAFGYDDTLATIFPDQVDARVGDRARTIRVRDVLSMASGHTQEMWDVVAAESRPEFDRSSMGAFLRHEPEGTPGATFAYNQPCTWAVSRAVHERAGVSVLDLLRERVFGRIGVDDAYWIPDADGVPLGFSGLHLTPRSIAAFFGLLAADGIIDGEQVLASEWIENVRRVQVSNGDPSLASDWTQGYGWQVWNARVGFRGDGAFGQFGIILPEQDLVVVMTGCTEDMQGVLDALWDEVLPELDGSQDEGAASALAARLDTWTVPALPRGPVAAWDGVWEGHAASLVQDGDTWRFRWADEHGEHAVPVGDGAWASSELRFAAADERARVRTLRVAACVGATNGVTTVRIAARNTPHSLFVTLRPDGLATSDWNLAPLHADRLADLAQPF